MIDKIEVLGPLYSVKAYAGLLAYLKTIGFNDSNLHLFSYDWRQSNFDTAKKFKQFIDERLNDGRLRCLSPGRSERAAEDLLHCLWQSDALDVTATADDFRLGSLTTQMDCPRYVRFSPHGDRMPTLPNPHWCRQSTMFSYEPQWL